MSINHVTSSMQENKPVFLSGNCLLFELPLTSACLACIPDAAPFHDPHGVLQTGEVMFTECGGSHVRDSSKVVRIQQFSEQVGLISL